MALHYVHLAERKKIKKEHATENIVSQIYIYFILVT